jgi:hypothetical protein
MTKTNLLANVKESSKAHTKLLFSPVNQTTDEIKCVFGIAVVVVVVV